MPGPAVLSLLALLLGGLRPPRAASPDSDPPADARVSAAQWLTLAVVGSWVAAVVVLRWHVGLSAFAAAVVLIVLRAGDEREALRRMPWPVLTFAR